MELMHKLEALLFSSGRKMSVEELSRLSRARAEEIVPLLQQLCAKYDAADSALMVVDEANGWKITVREKHLPLVRKIVAETELSRTIMETLAVVAWKAPVLQSDVIRIRTNKAYDHMRELEDAGFISRAKHGRTQLIRLTDRFFQYFDLEGKEEVQKRFSGMKEASTAIEKFEQQSKKPEPSDELQKAENASDTGESASNNAAAAMVDETSFAVDGKEQGSHEDEAPAPEVVGDKNRGSGEAAAAEETTDGHNHRSSDTAAKEQKSRGKKTG